MGAEIQRLQRKKRNGWQRVTNEMVMHFAAVDCERCAGKGFFTVEIRRPPPVPSSEGTVMVPQPAEQRPVMCVCTDAPFKKEYEGRLRRTKAGRLEFKPLTVTKALDDVQVLSPGAYEKLKRDE